MARGELSFRARQIRWQSGEAVEARVEPLLEHAPDAAVRQVLAVHVQQRAFESLDDRVPSIEKPVDEGAVIGERVHTRRRTRWLLPEQRRRDVAQLMTPHRPLVTAVVQLESVVNALRGQ